MPSKASVILHSGQMLFNKTLKKQQVSANNSGMTK